MKINHPALFIVTLITLGTFCNLYGQDTLIHTEVALDKVYIPSQGYDDNDAVELVVQGRLPNPCFTLGKTVVENVPGTNTLRVRQQAWMSLIQPCGAELLQDPIPFTNVASLGRMAASNYQIEFEGKQGLIQKQAFRVDSASTENIDNFRYAAIQSIDVKEIVFEEDEITITLNGEYSSTAQTLVRPIKWEVQNDVIVIFPVLQISGEASPEMKAIPFSEKLNLGKLKRGSYLLHSRARGGRAIYRAFNVWPKL